MDKVSFLHSSDEWSTPQDLFDDLDSLYHFTLDPCATPDNAKCDKFYTISDDGLSQSWDNESVFCNPPYSNIRAWLEKAISSRCHAVFLVPARTDTAWFHDLVYRHYHIEFLRGRLRIGNSKYNAPFPSMLIFIKPN